MRQTSRGKFNRLQRATAGFTTGTLDGCGLRCHWPARPPPYASYPVLVHRLASLLHASFRPRLATAPLRFAITSLHPDVKGTCTPKLLNMLGTQNKGRRGRRLPLSLTGALEVEFKRELDVSRRLGGVY